MVQTQGSGGSGGQRKWELRFFFNPYLQIFPFRVLSATLRLLQSKASLKQVQLAGNVLLFVVQEIKAENLSSKPLRPTLSIR